jgi:hypothetical protein
MRPLPVAVVGLADQAVETLVVEVIEPPLIPMARGLDAGESVLDEPVDEVVRLLAVRDSGETAVRQSIFCPAARRTTGGKQTRVCPPRRWAKDALD